MTARETQTGYSLVELIIAVGIAALLLVGLQQLLTTGVSAMAVVDSQTELARNGRFAMARMVDAVHQGGRLLIPLADNPATNFNENVREQTVPPSPPQGSSTRASAVLAVTLDQDQDIDSNSIADADNDGDGRIDEDLPGDAQNDGKAGIRDFDDDGNGTADFLFSPSGDDDESNDLAQSEDPINGVDDDGDGSVDEDSGADMNGDSAPGIAGFDDDGDGNVDEGGDAADDDEDGQSDEDWYDPVVFYLSGTALVERRSVPWDENADSIVNGRDFVESAIAENVTLIRFERIPSNGGQQLVDITLELTDVRGESISLNTKARLGEWR